jgi:hypothetical protein
MPVKSQIFGPYSEPKHQSIQNNMQIVDAFLSFLCILLRIMNIILTFC